MSDVAAIISDMVRAGVDPDLIGRAAAAFAQNVQIVQPVQDPVAEKRRAYDRERKAAKKNSTGIPPESADSTGTAPPILDKEKVAPKEIKPSPPISPLVGTRAQFVEFWALFPNKVGKRDAEREFTLALQRSSFDEIMAGLLRYVAKTDDRPWCNPSTFLHQNRWDDQPAAPQRRQNGHSPPNGKRMNAVEALQSLYSEPSHEPSRAPSTHDDAERFSTGRPGLPSVVVDFRRGPNGHFKPGDS